jgi:hypothetical protein
MLCLLAFIVAEAIPIFNYILAVAASLCLGPMSLIYPASMWLYSHPQAKSGNLKQKVMFGFHVFVILVGALMTVGGTYVPPSTSELAVIRKLTFFGT